MMDVKKMRAKDSIKSLFQEKESGNIDSLFLCSPSDIGVRRNLGRNGARFAPKTIMSQFQKMQNHQLKNLKLKEVQVSSQGDEISNYELAIENESKNIQKYITQNNIIHLGGGHDHAYPLLTALDSLKKEILIINIDAHLDTRVDSINHSGTPFRNFADSAQSKFKLIQYGIHHFANSESTFNEIKNGEMTIFPYEELKLKTKSFSQVYQFLENTEMRDDKIIYLSIDADALHSSFMKAVSAVNHNGLHLDHVIELMHYIFLKTKWQKSSWYL
jgi:formiminoglutamase